MSIHLISSFTASSNTVNVSFSNIPQVFSHLQIRWFLRGTFSPGQASNLGSIYVRANNDSGQNYNFHELLGDGVGVASTSLLNDTVLRAQRVSILNNSTASIFGVGIMNIYDYSASNKFKVSKSIGGCEQNISQGGSAILNSSVWRSNSSISSLTIFTDGSIATGSSIDLYGIFGSAV